MNNLDMQSVLKAGGIAAGLAIVLNILSLVPVIGGIFGFILVCGGIFIPILGGMGYGYFATGQEDTQTSAIGGALSGGVSGVIVGVGSALLSTDTLSVSGPIAGALCLGLMGFALGAAGGAVWPQIQDRVGGAS